MRDFKHFSNDTSLWEWSTQVVWGAFNFCPSLSQFQVKDVTQSELLALSHVGAWGNSERPKCDMAFPLIVLGKTIKGEMAFGLATVWPHPHQAHLSSLDEAVRKLTLLIDIGNNWVYGFVQLNKDALHVPLSNQAHISAMIDGVLSRSACWHLCQLEVHKLLQCRDQVVYPKGLNRGLEPVLLSLPKLPIWDMATLGEPVCKPSLLQVDLFWVLLGDQTPIIPDPCRASTSPSSPHSVIECPCEITKCTSMATELQELLSWAVLDTTGPVSRDTTLRRPTSAALGAPLTIRAEDQLRPERPVLATPKLVGISQQASMWAATPDDTVPISHLSSLTLVLEIPEVASVPTTQKSRTHTGTDSGTLSEKVLWLPGEMKRAMGWLLTTRASIDAHCRKQVSDTKTTFHQNEAQTAEVIKEVRAHCTTVIWDAKAMCAAAIREAEATCADCVCTIQQSHGESMQDIEREVIEEEGRDHQSVLIACWAALQACPPEAHGILMYPLQLLTGNMTLATLLAIFSQPSTKMGEPTPVTPHPTASVVPTLTLGIKQWHHSPDQEATSPRSGEEEATGTSEEPPHQKQKNVNPLMKLLKEGQWEAFTKDSDLVQNTRSVYFRTNHPNFDHKVSHDLSCTFWEMVDSAGLLDSEVQDTWTGWKELKYAHCAMMNFPKGLWFFCLVSPLELPKVMGLKGIHHPDALYHHTGLSYCPWYRKEGQNKGTVINHLQTMHYQLGLVCSRCLCFPATTSEVMWHQGQGYKQPGESDGKEEDGGPNDASMSD